MQLNRSGLPYSPPPDSRPGTPSTESDSDTSSIKEEGTDNRTSLLTVKTRLAGLPRSLSAGASSEFKAVVQPGKSIRKLPKSISVGGENEKETDSDAEGVEGAADLSYTGTPENSPRLSPRDKTGSCFEAFKKLIFAWNEKDGQDRYYKDRAKFNFRLESGDFKWIKTPSKNEEVTFDSILRIFKSISKLNPSDLTDDLGNLFSKISTHRTFADAMFENTEAQNLQNKLNWPNQIRSKNLTREGNALKNLRGLLKVWYKKNAEEVSYKDCKEYRPHLDRTQTFSWTKTKPNQQQLESTFKLLLDTIERAIPYDNTFEMDVGGFVNLLGFLLDITKHPAFAEAAKNARRRVSLLLMSLAWSKQTDFVINFLSFYDRFCCREIPKRINKLLINHQKKVCKEFSKTRALKKNKQQENLDHDLVKKLGLTSQIKGFDYAEVRLLLKEILLNPKILLVPTETAISNNLTSFFSDTLYQFSQFLNEVYRRENTIGSGKKKSELPSFECLTSVSKPVKLIKNSAEKLKEGSTDLAELYRKRKKKDESQLFFPPESAYQEGNYELFFNPKFTQIVARQKEPIIAILKNLILRLQALATIKLEKINQQINKAATKKFESIKKENEYKKAVEAKNTFVEKSSKSLERLNKEFAVTLFSKQPVDWDQLPRTIRQLVKLVEAICLETKQGFGKPKILPLKRKETSATTTKSNNPVYGKSKKDLEIATLRFSRRRSGSTMQSDSSSLLRRYKSDETTSSHRAFSSEDVTIIMEGSLKNFAQFLSSFLQKFQKLEITSENISSFMESDLSAFSQKFFIPPMNGKYVQQYLEIQCKNPGVVALFLNDEWVRLDSFIKTVQEDLSSKESDSTYFLRGLKQLVDRIFLMIEDKLTSIKRNSQIINRKQVTESSLIQLNSHFEEKISQIKMRLEKEFEKPTNQLVLLLNGLDDLLKEHLLASSPVTLIRGSFVNK